MSTQVSELHFKNMIVETLKMGLEEALITSDDRLVKRLIRNILERYQLDLLLHARALFPKQAKL